MNSNNKLLPQYKNLGTFSNPEFYYKNAKTSFDKYCGVNGVDKRAYKKLLAMEENVIKFASKITNHKDKFGILTSGSSEAIWQAMLIYLRLYKSKKPNSGKPNIVISENAHNAFDKISTFLDINLRKLPLNNDGSTNVENIKKVINRNTICAVGILGSTTTGSIDPIKYMSEIACKHNVPLHVDAAIGGFVMPFTKNRFVWDFKLKGVTSINLSFHKFGGSLPGLGILLIRKSHFLNKIKANIPYLSGGNTENNSILCSRNAGCLAAISEQIEKYGLSGYRKLMNKLMRTSRDFAKRHKNKLDFLYRAEDLPIVIFKNHKTKHLSRYLKNKGWIQSPYTIKITNNKLSYIRFVFKPHLIKYNLVKTLNKDLDNYFRNDD